MLIFVGLVDAEEHEIARFRGFFDVIPFLVEVLDVRVGDAQDQASRALLCQRSYRLSRYVGAS